jgi:hypothetical protein
VVLELFFFVAEARLFPLGFDSRPGPILISARRSSLDAIALSYCELPRSARQTDGQNFLLSGYRQATAVHHCNPGTEVSTFLVRKQSVFVCNSAHDRSKTFW